MICCLEGCLKFVLLLASSPFSSLKWPHGWSEGKISVDISCNYPENWNFCNRQWKNRASTRTQTQSLWLTVPVLYIHIHTSIFICSLLLLLCVKLGYFVWQFQHVCVVAESFVNHKPEARTRPACNGTFLMLMVITIRYKKLILVVCGWWDSVSWFHFCDICVCWPQMCPGPIWGRMHEGQQTLATYFQWPQIFSILTRSFTLLEWDMA